MDHVSLSARKLRRRKKTPPVHPVWSLFCVLAGALALGMISLWVAVGSYPIDIRQGYWETPAILWLNLLPPVALALLGYGLFRSARRGFLLTAVPVLGLSVANYYKLFFRDDPLMMGDLFLVKEAGNMLGNYSLFLDNRILECLAVAIGGYLFLLCLVRGRPEKGSRLRQVTTLLGATLLLVSFAATTDDGIYNGPARNYTHLSSAWSATQQYISRGCIYPFLHSYNDTVETPPEGYDSDQVEALLEQYEDGDIPEEKKVNVIAIMLEAYNDFSKFFVPGLSDEIYATWHRLESEGISGDLVTNIFAGGTVDTEQCFLTGAADLENYRGNVNTYAWYLRSQGYTVEGMHPCYDWFYNRKNINSYMGFENYYFVENYFTEYTNGNVGYDELFFRELLKTYREATADGDPYFSFCVTYQGHGPYNTEKFEREPQGSFLVNDGSLGEREETILHNYLGTQRNTNYWLNYFVDQLREDPEPVVLVLFGDHNPWMGDGNEVYKALGVNFDLSTQEGFMNYYGTRYIIWGNEAAKEALGLELQGEGATVSPTFLMNEVFRQLGWTGPAYMQATDEIRERVSVINTPTGLYMEDGALTGELSEEGQALVDRFYCLEYYERKHFAYQELLQ